MTDLVIFPFVDLKKCEKEGYRTRDAHLIKSFEKMKSIERILVVNRPTSIAECIIYNRNWKTPGSTPLYQDRTSRLATLSEKIFCLDILLPDIFSPILLRHRWWARCFEKRAVQEKITDAIARLELADVQLHIFTPLAVAAFDFVDNANSIFFAVDDWSLHPQFQNARPDIDAGYKTASMRADAIITTSHQLSQKFKDCDALVKFLPNGVDASHFRDRRFTSVPAIDKLPSPIIGYAGKIQERLDLDLVREISTAFPDSSLVFIGPLMSRSIERAFERLPNVHWLGDVPYDKLPDYLHSFTICIVPHHTDGLSKSMNPLKVYEYLAANKKVVTTKIAGVQSIPNWVNVAENHEHFIMLLERSLALPQSESYFPVPSSWSWDSIAVEVQRTLNGDI